LKFLTHHFSNAGITMLYIGRVIRNEQSKCLKKYILNNSSRSNVFEKDIGIDGNTIRSSRIRNKKMKQEVHYCVKIKKQCLYYFILQ
jgi:hypothetical protein